MITAVVQQGDDITSKRLADSSFLRSAATVAFASMLLVPNACFLSSRSVRRCLSPSAPTRVMKFLVPGGSWGRKAGISSAPESGSRVKALLTKQAYCLPERNQREMLREDGSI
jgi:hypothetical protein